MPVEEDWDAVSETPSRSSSNGGSLRRKKKVIDTRPYSLEELYLQMSPFRANILNPPATSIVLTPRSAEVVLEMGINPELVKERTFDSFWEEGIDPPVQEFKYKAYSKRREEIMLKCRLDRKRRDKILKEKMKAKEKLDGATSRIDGGGELTPEQILAQQAEQNSAVIQLERARMEKMKARQAKELNKMISFEVGMVKVREDMETRLALTKQKEREKEKSERKRLASVAEARRMRDIKKATMEEVEEAKSKHMTAIMREKERELIRQAEEKAYLQRKDAEKREIEKRIKIREQKEKLKAYFDNEQIQLREKVNAMTGHEEKKKKAIWKASREKARESTVKREAAALRITENQKAAESIQKKRQTDFITKQERSMQMRYEKQLQEDYSYAVKSERKSLEEERRKYKLLKFKNDEARQLDILRQKAIEEEQNLENVIQKRTRDRQLMLAEREVHDQIKSEVVSRAKKIADFKRSNILSKIEESDARIEAMNRQKEELKTERRLQAVKTRLQKEQIGVVMDGVRSDATKASKMVTKAMSGNVSLETLIAPPVNRNNEKRKLAAKKRQAQAEMSRLLRESQSAGEHVRHLPSFEAVRAKEATAMYISPYELPYDVGIGDSMEQHLQAAQAAKEAAKTQGGGMSVTL